MVNAKTTAVRLIPALGKNVGDMVSFGGLLGEAPVMPVHPESAADFIARGGRIPAPMQSLKKLNFHRAAPCGTPSDGSAGAEFISIRSQPRGHSLKCVNFRHISQGNARFIHNLPDFLSNTIQKLRRCLL